MAVSYRVDDSVRARCPTDDELVARIAAEIGHDPRDADAAASLDVVITVDDSGRALDGTWTLRGLGQGDHGRSLKAGRAECDELVASLALSISVVLDRIARERAAATPAQARAPAPAPRSSQVWTEPAPPAFDKPAPPSEPEPGPAPRLLLAFGGHGAAGTSPGITAGVTAGVGMWLDPFSIRGEGRVDADKAQLDAAGHGAAVQLYTGAVVPCLHLGVAEACGVLSMGAIESANIGLSGIPSATSFYAAAGVRPGLSFPLTRNVLLEVHGEVLATLTPLELRSAGAEIWSLSPVTGSLGTGFFFRHP